MNKSDRLFVEQTIRDSIVPLWKYYLLPLTLKWQQVRWITKTADGKKKVIRGLIKL